MSNPKVGEIVWLIRISGNNLDIIGFLRGEATLGALILGGTTGTHCTGHGETWESKWRELVTAGYITCSDAKKKKLISSNWIPPGILKKDQELVRVFRKKSEHL